MKKLTSMIFAAALMSSQAATADSVYSWGSWSQGIKPAAGPVASVTPPPAQKPQVNFRPNEAPNLTRTTVQIQPPAPVPVPVVTPTVTIPVVASTNGAATITPGTVLTPPPARTRR